MSRQQAPGQQIDLAFDNSFARELPGFYASQDPEKSPKPSLVFFNELLANELDLELSDQPPQQLAELFCGNQLPTQAQPIAQAYAGHQFGYFNPQLGDGRALILGEVVTKKGGRFDLNLKGSGKTPFSRSGDGKAALGPMLREVIMAEGLHALGIPTTRALAVVSTGAPVYRERVLPGAVLTRVAASHIRIGTFEFFASRGEFDKVKQLADYTIARHDPQLQDHDQKYLHFLLAVMKRQASLVAKWMGLGFIHGVMNTDNTSIAGETIDYGPCAFMEAYDPKTVFSSIDAHGRYAYQNQPRIIQWNLARLAETLLPLLAEDQEKAVELATETISQFATVYQEQWLQVMRTKLGLNPIAEDNSSEDLTLVEEWLALLEGQNIDFTNAWRGLTEASHGEEKTLRSLFQNQQPLQAWFTQWQARCAKENRSPEQRTLLMQQANPWIIPRNHLVEQALTQASEQGDMKMFGKLMEALKQPFETQVGFKEFTQPASQAFTEAYMTFCGT